MPIMGKFGDLVELVCFSKFPLVDEIAVRRAAWRSGQLSAVHFGALTASGNICHGLLIAFLNAPLTEWKSVSNYNHISEAAHTNIDVLD